MNWHSFIKKKITGSSNLHGWDTPQGFKGAWNVYHESISVVEFQQGLTVKTGKNDLALSLKKLFQSISSKNFSNWERFVRDGND